MTKFIIAIVGAILLFSFNEKAYCWSLNDIQNTVQQAASGVTKNRPTGTSNNNTTQQQTAAQSDQVNQQAIPDYIKVDKGSYGLPLGATMDAFLAWCKEKNVSIGEQTDAQLKETISQMLRSIRLDANLTGAALEKELDDTMARADVDNDIKLAIVFQIKPKIAILNGPSLNYSGNTYLMEPLFYNAEKGNGIPYAVPGENNSKICSSDGVVKNSYEVTLTPSKEMKDGGISAMLVFFVKKDQGLKTYAVITEYSDSDIGKQKDQWTLINDTLTKKYQTPVEIDVASNAAEISVGVPVAPEALQEEKAKNAIRQPLNQDAYYLLGTFSSQSIEGQEYYMFGRNVVLTGKEQTVGRNRGSIDWSQPCYVFYVEPDLGKEVLQMRTNAIQSCRDQAIAEKNQQMKSSANNI